MARRILLLITDMEIGGTPTVVRELAMRLRRPAAEVEVACLSRWGPLADQLRAGDVPVTALDSKNALDAIRTTRRLIAHIRDREYDTVFSFLVHANAVAAAAARFLPSVRFIQSIQTSQPSPRWHWLVQSAAHGRAERIVVPTVSAARAAMDWSQVPARKIEIIPNAIDPEAFVRRQSPLADSPFPIGFIGRLDRVKRVSLLIEAVGRLRQNFHLHIFGEGPDRRRIEAEIQRAHLTHRVTLHGRIDRPQEALSRIALLVLPSRAEGFGLVLIEAMAAGVAVVGADAPGIRDVVQHGRTGLLARPTELTATIARVIDDRTLRQRLIDAAFHDVHARFTWDEILPRYEQLLHLRPRAPKRATPH